MAEYFQGALVGMAGRPLMASYMVSYTFERLPSECLGKFLGVALGALANQAVPGVYLWEICRDVVLRGINESLAASNPRRPDPVELCSSAVMGLLTVNKPTWAEELRRSCRAELPQGMRGTFDASMRGLAWPKAEEVRGLKYE
jgi:hypothetical protein